MTADVIQLFPKTAQPDCARCSNGLVLNDGDVYCLAYGEVSLDPVYVAERCAIYEPER